ncbi:hypothetical protein EJ08DRAFT_702787 [Tothia fuscella]|uniref:RSE1/DDB1/CPSF1 first beta-propeller domain-containing protein n=1 Tax=Tothia fuscella TaxID=1048955 RepID=A0A9P4NFP0_9PEZI|nr:hypothetical protein EJ08DRAFT_702787 [Tothia fuscella]
MSITSNVLVNGEYIPQRMSIQHILNQNRKEETEDLLKVHRKSKSRPQIGLLSRTLIRSPMVKWIIPARIRKEKCNDLIFISENSLHIKEIHSGGVLSDVGTKADFPAQIRSAAVLGEQVDVQEKLDPRVKEEDSEPEDPNAFPPQILVIALASAELRFLVVDNTYDGDTLHFHESTIPLPVDQSAPKTPGKYLVVDPLSRAIAVAASRDTIVLYGLKDWKTLSQEYTADQSDWNPIEHERLLKVDGPILAMDFINPDSKENDRVVLVVIVAVHNKSKLGCYEWTIANGPEDLKPVVENYRFFQSKSDPKPHSDGLCNLIIPMQHSPSFLLVHGPNIKLCNDILTGQPYLCEFIVKSTDESPRYPAASKRLPVYTSWRRVPRSKTWKTSKEEALHLVREDGIIHYIQRSVEGGPGDKSVVGQFGCSVGSAFTNFFTNLAEADYLVSTGCLGPGEVLSIGDPRQHDGKEIKRADAMQPQSQGTLPNWSPIMDLEIAQPRVREGAGVAGSRPSIYTTSGRQPHGAITELRIGREAKVIMEVDVAEADGMNGAYGIWAVGEWTLDDPAEEEPILGNILFVSYPGSTSTWHYSAAIHKMQHIELDADLNHATLLAVETRDELILQVTEKSLLLVSPVSDGEKLIPKVGMTDGQTIVAAAYHDQSGEDAFIIIAVRDSNAVTLQLRKVDTLDLIGDELPLDSDLTCLHVFASHEGQKVFAIAGLRDGTLHLFNTDPSKGLVRVSTHSMGTIASTQSHAIGESIIVLRDTSGFSAEYLVMCGLRDGNVYTIKLKTSADDRTDKIEWGSTEIINMGTSPVNLKCFPVPNYHNTGSSKQIAFAMCGTDTVQIECPTFANTIAPTITSIHFTDPTQPSYSQPTLSSLSTTPPWNANYTANLISIDGSILRFSTLESNTGVIPRSIPLKSQYTSDESAVIFAESPGTPQRLLYSSRLNAMVVASTKCELVPPALHPPKMLWLGKRINRAILQFIPMATPSPVLDSSDAESQEISTTIPLNPSERIRTIIEWDCKINDSGGGFNCILVGTSVTGADGRKKGKLWCFEPKLSGRGDGSVDVTLRFVKGIDSPVRALAVYDDRRVVLSGNLGLNVYGFVTEAGRPKWRQITSTPLLSQATFITVHKPIIHLTTSSDSMQAFELKTHTSPTPDAPPTYTLDHTFNHGTARAATMHFPVVLPPGSLNISATQERGIMENGDSIQENGDEETPDAERPSLILVADKHGDVVGLAHPSRRTHQLACETLFELPLPQCVTRFSRGAIRAPWRVHIDDAGGSGVKGVIADDIIGSCTDGTVYSFSILNAPAISLLKFLEERMEGGGRGKDLGFDLDYAGGEGKKKFGINGDGLVRFAEKGGMGVLKGILGIGRERDIQIFRKLWGNVLGKDLRGLDLEVLMGEFLEWLRQVLQLML